ncbi:unnamed protein product [Moneuplotes crassus]|uniref:ALMS motif domain-containing protein n=1 Tax=Euplotes crassus TaxID=5936 RepID=A0AAD1X8G1_EUPCR|nr:unnamed protein product [Moneuplotes crassus]
MDDRKPFQNLHAQKDGINSQIPYLEVSICKQDGQLDILEKKNKNFPNYGARSNSVAKKSSGQPNGKNTTAAKPSGSNTNPASSRNMNSRSKPQILIDKNKKFGKKQRFKPLEKLERKHLQEDDPVESLDMSINFGPVTFDEAVRDPDEAFSSDEKSGGHFKEAINAHKQSDGEVDSSDDQIQNLPITHKMTPKKNLSKSNLKKRRRTPDLSKNCSCKSQRNNDVTPPVERLQKKYSLGIPGHYRHNQDEIPGEREDACIFDKKIQKNYYQAPVKIVKLNSPDSTRKSRGEKSTSSRRKLSRKKVSTSPKIRIPRHAKDFNKEVKLCYDNSLQNFDANYDKNYEPENESDDEAHEQDQTLNKKICTPQNIDNKRDDENFGISDNIYFKTFENDQPERIQKIVDEKKEIKPILKHKNQKNFKRMRSPAINIERLDDQQVAQQEDRQTKKLLRRRSTKGEIPHDKETELKKQEYLKLKKVLNQKMMELRRVNQTNKKRNKSRKNMERSNVYNNNPPPKEQNSKFVRFNMEEAHRKAGKTPKNRKGVAFNFEASSSDDGKPIIQKEYSAQYQSQYKDKEDDQIGVQYNKSRHSNSLLICKINKVENLKIVHTTEDSQFKRRKFSTKSKADNQDSSHFAENERMQYPQSVGRNDGAKTHRQRNNIDKATSFVQGNKNRLTRNPNTPKEVESKTYHNHMHHNSSHVGDDGRNGSKFPYDSKLLEVSKKRNRKDFKSGDAKANNFKFMNLNWLNQNKNDQLPSFYANQMVAGGLDNTSSIYQNLELSNINYANQNEISGLVNQNDLSSLISQNQLGQMQLNNNQSLLVYDKQTNSIIPLNPGVKGQGNNILINNPPFAGSGLQNNIEIEKTPSRSGLETTRTEVRNDRGGNIPFYFQDAKLQLDFSNNVTPDTKRCSDLLIGKDISNIQLDLDDSQINPINKISSNFASNSKENDKLDSSVQITTKSSLVQVNSKDSLNLRQETGIRNIEISRLKASDYDLNNRESQSINGDYLISKRQFKLPRDTIIEESDHGDSIQPTKTSTDSKLVDEDSKISHKESVIWVGDDTIQDNATLLKKKKIMEKRLNNRNRQRSAKSRGKSENIPDQDASENTIRHLETTYNKFPESMLKNNKFSTIEQSDSGNFDIKRKENKLVQKKSPIFVDLMSSHDVNHESTDSHRVLNSGDNPISSISSKGGLMNFNAFQSDSSRPKLEEPMIIGAQDTNASLAEMFKSKNKGIANKLSQRQNCKSKNRAQKKPKTKEELADIRKNMMKKRHRSTSPSDVLGDIKQSTLKDTSIGGEAWGLKGKGNKSKPRQKCREPPPELLERLAGKKKKKITEKEFRQHASKNYEKLPEVRKRKEEQKKKDEIKARLNRAKEFDKKRSERYGHKQKN